MRAHDWSTSSLGPPEQWAQSLRTTVSLMLNSRYPMFIAWGPELAFLYNDGYRPIFGAKHPQTLGLPFKQVWSEIWTDIEPLVEKALAGEATFNENLHLVMERNGFPEDTWYTFSYSPVRDETGGVGGMFCACQETTQQVLAEKRLASQADRHLRLFQQAPGFIGVTIGEDHIYEFVNDAYVRLIGERDYIGRPVRLVVPEAEDQGFLDLLDEVYRTGEPYVAYSQPLVVTNPKTGALEERFLDFIYQATRNEDGGVTGIFVEGHDVTEGYLAEERLRESENRFRNMADHAAVMMWVTEPDGHCTYLNRGWYEFTGQDRAQAEGFGWLDAVHPDDRLRAETDFREANASRTAFRAEYRLRRADGVYRWAIDAASPRFGEGGEWLGYVGSVIDIDERREAEDRLRQSGERFQAAIAAVQGVLWTNNAVGEMEGSQPAWAALTGQTLEEYQGYGWARAIHPDDVEPTVEAWNEAVAERKTFVFEHRVRRQVEGDWRQFAIRAIPLFDQTGEVTEWVGVHTDVTELREVEAALRDGEARFRAMAEAMPGFVWTADALGSLDYTSPRWSEYSGDVAGDGLGSGWAEFVHDDDKPSAFAAWQASLETLLPYAVEFRLRSRDGHYRWWLVRAMPVVDPGRPIRWIGSATDIDEIVEARDVLARSQVELEQRVAERSAELMQTQEALRQSQKLEAMGQLTGGVAHDFNNLLTPIVGALDVLQRRGVGGEREQRLIEGALQSSERARVLVQRLLAFARRQPLQSQAVDVDALVSGMADLIASTSGPGIKVVVDIDPNLQAARADPNQIEMAVLNLSVNARDAMPNGGRLTISASDEVVTGPHRAGLRPGDYVRISVADTGTGMDEATAARAIEPFYSTKGVGKGTGLGLSMVHGLASQLGGTLLISSKVGLGTRIEFWLPATVHAQASVDGPAPADVSDGTANGTILLVDDEDLVRLSTADMLIEMGFVVIETTSAEDALVVLQEGADISAVITDHLMPGMTGVDLARIVKKTWPLTPVLIVSGYAEGEGIASDLPRMSKPFRKADLTNSLVSLIEPRS